MARICSVFASVAALSLGVVTSGCGNGDPKTPKVVPGDMPSGESWTGVYYHPVFGYLHLVEEGTNVVGRWKTTDQSRWGELSGTKSGNVLHYAWKEHKIGMVGAAAESTGHGYFQYKPGTDNPTIAELDGQFGLGAAETGSDWHNIKQQGRTADLKSVTADVPGQTGGNPGWQ